MLRRDDREIFALALPALGALAAEPLYVLVDTAIVGHLGTAPLAALAIAGTILTATFTLFNFLTYGTTAQVARLSGAGATDAANGLAAQAMWLALAFSGGLVLLALALAGPLVDAMGAAPGVRHDAVLYLRLAALGLPGAFLALAGQGWLRGVGDLRRPLVIVVVANLANVVLELLFVYGFGWGIAGSAAGTAIAQLGMGAAFVVELLRPPAASRRPRLAAMRPLVRIGRQIFVRTTALYASFVVAGAVLARIGSPSLAAHQIAFQLWTFLALVLDAIAIAGQVLVGRALGSGDAAGAYASARRMIGWSVIVGGAFAVLLAAFGGLIPDLFTDDARVVERAEVVWPLFCAMLPLNGAVFALDGILIGAGDTAFLMWSMLFSALGVFVPVALLALGLGWGIAGVWAGLFGLIAARLTTTGARFAGRRWAVVGY